MGKVARYVVHVVVKYIHLPRLCRLSEAVNRTVAESGRLVPSSSYRPPPPPVFLQPIECGLR